MISVITIVLNGESEIENTIQSVIFQQRIDVDYIIIDGGSTDRTAEIVEKYRNHISYFVSERDGGIYEAINKGIRTAKSEYIGTVNCGDTLAPGALDLVKDAIESHRPDIVFGNIKVCDRRLGVEVSTVHIANHLNLRQHMSVFHPATFVRRDCYEEIGLYDTNYRIAADYDFLLRCYLQGKSFCHVNSILSIFQSGGVSGTSVRTLFLENFKIRKNAMGFYIAVNWAIRNISVNVYYRSRRWILIALFGKTRFVKMKSWFQKTRER